MSAALDEEVRVYWMTGCTSCLRTKEFLARHRIPFLSRNVLVDEAAYAELERFGLRQVPIVTRGGSWANGQVLRDVADLVGIDLGAPQILPVAELRRRQEAILAGVQRFAAQLPEESLGTLLPDRPRSHADLVYHIVNIVDAFLEHEAGIPLTYEAYFRLPPRAEKAGLLAYAADVEARLRAWFAGPGRTRDWTETAQVYYGRQSLHEFFERTVWHSGQHTRQLIWVLERMGIAPDGKLGPEVFAGLPMPQEVWG
ncbi:DinB family protein [Belnapia sp. T6]|uniref:DinB family protein n=1 Tax=Belnapia mucosa TaxID=2804532 RepID=A0ABS1VBZ1_9PROT|nr:DinB family protein [Belnapia mucosa]MBL6459190.1 DinB family protein [Belnapia mucosa]